MSHLQHLLYRRYLDAHVDGELTGSRAARVGDHVAECPTCSRRATLTVKVKDRLARRRHLTERAADRIRHWAHRELS